MSAQALSDFFAVAEPEKILSREVAAVYSLACPFLWRRDAKRSNKTERANDQTNHWLNILTQR
ncbi:hypothetical protein CHCC20348_4101 [Bacillus paralicheniformis]|nr:hypothetical protein CHCC20348_4101 [Bacillus paralicheniformis]